MRIAGIEIEEPLESVLRYVHEHGKTIAEFDLAPRPPNDRLTAEDVSRRVALLDGRLRGRAEWFVRRAAQTRLWGKVALAASLAEAEPEREAWQVMERLYEHFIVPREPHVGRARVHKVLHFMRPGLYPILDGRLECLYLGAACEVARARGHQPPPWAAHYWQAIRRDLRANLGELHELRRALAASRHPAIARVASRRERSLEDVSELRLLDILAWSLVS